MRNSDEARDIDDTVWRRVRQGTPVQLSESHPATRLLEGLRRLVPFDSYSAAGLDLAGCEVGRGLHLTTTLSREFLDRYRREDFFKVDPLVQMLTPQTPVARWHDVSASELIKPEMAGLLETLQLYRIPPRTVVGFFRAQKQYGGIAFMREDRFTDSEVNFLLHFGFEIYRSIAKPIIQQDNAYLRITTGEQLCLNLMAKGLTSDEIAIQTQYTVETVTSYLKSLMRKLNVSNRPQAVAVGIRRGIVD